MTDDLAAKRRRLDLALEHAVKALINPPADGDFSQCGSELRAAMDALESPTMATVSYPVDANGAPV